MMRNAIFFLLACIACMRHGHTAQSTGQSLADFSESRLSRQAGAIHKFEALARLLVALDPIAGWQMTAQHCRRQFAAHPGSKCARFHRLASTVKAADQPWQDSEDWALIDRAKEFTVGTGSGMSTFWTALVASTPELSTRSATDCEQRYKELDAKRPDVGSQPLVLQDWSRLEDGRYTGRVAGENSNVWLTVAAEGRLAGDPRVDEPGYIEAVGGRIFELGARAAAVAAAGGPFSEAGTPTAAATQEGGLLQSLPKAASTVLLGVVGAVVAGGVGFLGGTALAPPPPAPAPQVKVIVATRSSERTATKTATTARAADQRQSAPLTVAEQRQRAELKIERDKVRLDNMKQQLKEDEQKLTEIQRIEAERGADSAAVKLIFPSRD